MKIWTIEESGVDNEDKLREIESWVKDRNRDALQSNDGKVTILPKNQFIPATNRWIGIMPQNILPTQPRLCMTKAVPIDTSIDRKRGCKDGKTTTLEPKNGF